MSRPLIRRRRGNGASLLLGVVTSEYGLYFSGVLHLILMAFPLLRPPSPSKRQAVGSVVSPAITTPAAPAESCGSGSAKGQSASGLSVVLKFTKPKKFVMKHSSQ